PTAAGAADGRVAGHNGGAAARRRPEGHVDTAARAGAARSAGAAGPAQRGIASEQAIGNGCAEEYPDAAARGSKPGAARTAGAADDLVPDEIAAADAQRAIDSDAAAVAKANGGGSAWRQRRADSPVTDQGRIDHGQVHEAIEPAALP